MTALLLEMCLFGLELHVSYSWRATALNTHHGQFLIHPFVRISSYNPPEVYQACSTQIRSGRRVCRCGVCVGVVTYKTFAFFFSLIYTTTFPDATF